MKIKLHVVPIIIGFLICSCTNSRNDIDKAIIEIGKDYGFEVKQVQYFTRPVAQKNDLEGVQVKVSVTVDSTGVYKDNNEFLLSLFALGEFEMLDSLGLSNEFDIYNTKCYINEKYTAENEYTREELKQAMEYEMKFDSFIQTVESSDTNHVYSVSVRATTYTNLCKLCSLLKTGMVLG